MRKVGKAVILGALIGAMALVLVACGGGGGSAASGSAASADAPKDVYVVAKAAAYGEDGALQGTVAYERDEHGNVVKQISHNEGNDNDSVVEYTLDENGVAVGLKQPDGQEVTYEPTYDGDKYVKLVGSNDYITERTYYDNGVLKEQVSKKDDEYKSIISFDESGYQIQKAVAFGNGDSTREGITSYTWEFDESGMPTSLTVEQTKLDEGISMGGFPVGKYEIECDANGNIVKYTNAETGKVAYEYEYVKVDDPSVTVKYAGMLTSVL